MNAHTDVTIKDADALVFVTGRAKVRTWHISSSFKDGLCEGFGAPVFILRRYEYPRAEKIDTSLGAAWRAVGSALKEATMVHGGKIAKTARKGSKNARKAPVTG